MDIIKFVVKGQRLFLKTHRKKIVCDTINYFKCQFIFGPEWDGFDIRISFKNASFNITKVVLPDDSGYCYVPWEVLAHTGVVLCSVTGIKFVDGEAVRLTTNAVKMFAHNSDEGSINATDYVNPTLTEYEQYIEQVRQNALDALEAKDAAIEAKVTAEFARLKIENMEVSAVDLPEGSPASVTKTVYDDYLALEFGIPAGHSPEITAEKVDTITTLYVDGVDVAVVEDGIDGVDGQDGEDGYSPSASVSKVGDTAIITITDKDGTTTASVADGVAPVVFDYDLDNPVTPNLTDVSRAYTSGKSCYVHVHRSSDPYDISEILSLVSLSTEYYLFFAVNGTTGHYSVLSYDSSSMSPANYSTGYLQKQLVSGTNIKTINNTSILGSGNIDVASKNVWFGTCNTSSSTSAKVATTTSGDFVLETGNIVQILFDVKNNYNGTATLSVDGTTAKPIHTVAGDTNAYEHWTAKEVVSFVYDGTAFVMLEKAHASTSNYGVVKLSSATDNTTSSLAATPSAVKKAYDLASGKSTVSVSPITSSGTNIADITIDGITTQLYAPNGGGNAEIVYCECADSDSTVAKTASVVTGSFTSLTTGALVAVKFTYTNTAIDPTLNVAGTGAKAIMRGGTSHVGPNASSSWNAGTVVFMLYDGSVWNIVGWLNTTYIGGTEYEIETGTEALNKVWSPQQIHNGIVRLLPSIPEFTATEHKILSSFSVNQNSQKTGTVTVTKSGYYPLGIIGFRCANGSGSGGSYAFPHDLHISNLTTGSVDVVYGIRAFGGNISSCDYYVRILWIKQ